MLTNAGLDTGDMLLKREVERHGETFWAGFDAWMAAKGNAA